MVRIPARPLHLRRIVRKAVRVGRKPLDARVQLLADRLIVRHLKLLPDKRKLLPDGIALQLQRGPLRKELIEVRLRVRKTPADIADPLKRFQIHGVSRAEPRELLLIPERGI